MISLLETMARVARRLVGRSAVEGWPETGPRLAPRFRGRIVLTRDPSGVERCVACNLCAVACPVDCIDVEQTVDDAGRWVPETFRINFSRCIFCGLCEEACPTLAIQLIPDFEMSEHDRAALVYEKEDLTIAGGGKHPDYDFRAEAGLADADRPAGAGRQDAPPTDPKGLRP